MKSSGLPLGKKVCADHGRAGMTLLEMVIAMGIFAIVAMLGLFTMLSSIDRNRSTELAVAGTMTARQAMEEVISLAESTTNLESVAADAQSNYSRPLELIRYLLSNRVPDRYTITPEGGSHLTRIVCDFPARLPGRAARDAAGNSTKELELAAEGRGRVRMVLYLEESSVPVRHGSTSSQLYANILPDGNGSVSGLRAGFDMNGDGKISSGGFLTNSNNPIFNFPGMGAGYRRVKQLPVDVIVNYKELGEASGEQESIYRFVVNDAS